MIKVGRKNRVSEKQCKKFTRLWIQWKCKININQNVIQFGQRKHLKKNHQRIYPRWILWHCQGKRNCDKRIDKKNERKGKGEWEYTLDRKKKRIKGLSCVYNNGEMRLFTYRWWSVAVALNKEKSVMMYL